MPLTKKDIREIFIHTDSHHHSKNIYMMHGVTKIQAFLAIRRLLKGKLYWFALQEAYTMSDNLIQYKFDLIDAFSSAEPERDTVMNKREKLFYDSLPNKVKIYRAMTREEKNEKYFGISWTLQKETAKYFETVYGRNIDTKHLPKTVYSRIVDKSEIIAYFNSRKENEIIYISKETKRIITPKVFKLPTKLQKTS